MQSNMPGLVLAGQNSTLLWGLSADERVARIAAAQGLDAGPRAPGAGTLLVNRAFVFDPAWLRTIAARPGTVLTLAGMPAIAHCRDGTDLDGLRAAMDVGAPLPVETGLDRLAFEDADAMVNSELRKREQPFLMRLGPATVRAAERASYFGAYKGVTDLLTKYLWPEWALVLTRLAARFGVTPNAVTVIGMILCVLATILFWRGHYWPGLAIGLVFMVLDTVDGKLARVTITSSKLGEILDHGVDLVHPPFWWWAWAVGLTAYGRPLELDYQYLLLAVIVGGYVVQRLIEGAFIAVFGMHIHVWRRLDSRFRLITARRNPNMVILFACLAAGRPDWGLIAVAWWTALSCLFHLVRLAQAFLQRAGGKAIRSWLD